MTGMKMVRDLLAVVSLFCFFSSLFFWYHFAFSFVTSDPIPLEVSVDIPNLFSISISHESLYPLAIGFYIVALFLILFVIFSMNIEYESKAKPLLVVCLVILAIIQFVPLLMFFSPTC
jgi:hypothetical protein